MDNFEWRKHWKWFGENECSSQLSFIVLMNNSNWLPWDENAQCSTELFGHVGSIKQDQISLLNMITQRKTLDYFLLFSRDPSGQCKEYGCPGGRWVLCMRLSDCSQIRTNVLCRIAHADRCLTGSKIHMKTNILNVCFYWKCQLDQSKLKKRLYSIYLDVFRVQWKIHENMMHRFSKQQLN